MPSPKQKTPLYGKIMGEGFGELFILLAAVIVGIYITTNPTGKEAIVMIIWMFGLLAAGATIRVFLREER